MIPAPLPIDEEDRLKALYGFHILETVEDKVFNSITKIASLLCQVPISLISLIDRDKVWVISASGIKKGQ
jgi:hypothetical protein